MKLINIHSLPNIQKEYAQDMHMFLAHLVQKNKEYRTVARECKGFKILDNSVIELGSAMDPGIIIEAAKEIGANEVVIPDAYMDGARTRDLMSEMLPIFKKEIPWCQRMVVIHGKDIEDWFTTLRFARNYIDDIDTIGIPKCAAKMHPQGREFFIRFMFNNYTTRIWGTKKLHLLGLQYGMWELHILPQQFQELIRSCDTIMGEWMSYVGTQHRPDGWTIDLETGELIQK